VRTAVLDDQRPFVPLLIERERGETQLFVKEVKAGGRRYIVCPILVRSQSSFLARRSSWRNERTARS
jgi:hypothetical protein